MRQQLIREPNWLIASFTICGIQLFLFSKCNSETSALFGSIFVKFYFELVNRHPNKKVPTVLIKAGFERMKFLQVLVNHELNLHSKYRKSSKDFSASQQIWNQKISQNIASAIYRGTVAHNFSSGSCSMLREVWLWQFYRHNSGHQCRKGNMHRREWILENWSWILETSIILISKLLTTQIWLLLARRKLPSSLPRTSFTNCFSALTVRKRRKLKEKYFMGKAKITKLLKKCRLSSI